MSTSKPNVLVLLSDQHNRRIAGFAGNPIAHTPNLDRLASGSVRFERAYCQFPLCTPSRISMWTGRLPHLCGAWGNNSPIAPEYLTIPEHFERHGYVTCGIGKMHVGGDRPMNGFMYRPYGDLIPNCFCGHQPDPIRTAKDQEWTRHDIGHFPFAGVSEVPEETMQDVVVTREALSFIEEHSASSPDQPWFVCASYQRPHHPFTAPRRHFERFWPDGPELPPLPQGFPDAIHPHDRFIVDDYRLTAFSEEERRKCLAAYYASVSFLDECIGGLLDGLGQSGRLENTVIVYVADHGDMMGEHGLWWKRSYYDGSACVPLLIRPAAPASLPASVPGIVELLDLFPTLCDLAGLPHPQHLDGESLVPLLDMLRYSKLSGLDLERQEPSSPSRSAAGHIEGLQPRVVEHQIRVKDFARSEHIGRMETTFRMIRTVEWKYVEFPEYPPVLFDMVNDPGEERNIAHLPEYDTVVDDLHRRLWEDCESFDGMMSARHDDRERLRNEFPVRCDCTPNQYALPSGELIDAEASLYGPYLERGT